MLGVLAKAKRIGTDEWIEGYYVFQHGAHQIYLPDGQDHEYGFDYYHVDVTTLCLWTGRCDINKKKIWTNDVVKTCEFTKTGVVVYSVEDASFCLQTDDGCTYLLLYFDEYEVLNNKFDAVIGGSSNEHSNAV